MGLAQKVAVNSASQAASQLFAALAGILSVGIAARYLSVNEYGEVVTACQAACPAAAIVFGDLNDKRSVVARAKDTRLNYGLREELNTVPRTTYLAEVRNPNPDPDLKG